jgi:hypothetical protein
MLAMTAMHIGAKGRLSSFSIVLYLFRAMPPHIEIHPLPNRVLTPCPATTTSTGSPQNMQIERQPHAQRDTGQITGLPSTGFPASGAAVKVRAALAFA